jgi:hypothetical protein
MDREPHDASRSKCPVHDEERRGFCVCKACGPAVDKRWPGDLVHDEEPGHETIPVTNRALGI